MIKLIVADESEAIVKAFKMAVAAYEVEVLTAASAGDLLRLLKSFTPDYMFLSSRLPGVQNLDWNNDSLKMLKSEKLTVLVSNFGGQDVLPVESQLEKPFTADQVLEILSNYFGESLLRDLKRKVTGASGTHEEPLSDMFESSLTDEIASKSLESASSSFSYREEADKLEDLYLWRLRCMGLSKRLNAL